MYAYIYTHWGGHVLMNIQLLEWATDQATGVYKMATLQLSCNWYLLNSEISGILAWWFEYVQNINGIIGTHV